MNLPIWSQVRDASTSGIRKKMSTESQDMEKQLESEKKVLSALYEEELIGEKKMDEFIKK